MARFLLLLLMVLVVPFQAAAQLPNMDPFYFHAADVALLQAKQVQKELGVTEPQRARMNQFADKHRQRLSALAGEYKKAGKSEQQATQDPRLVGYFIELKKNVMSQLSAAQLKRLGEISLQHLGLAALTDDKVGARIGLSKDQIQQMRNAFQDGGKKYGAAEKAAADPVLNKYKDRHVKDKKEAEALQKQFDAELAAVMKKAAPQLSAIKSETEKQMRGILSAKQMAAWKALLGKPFKP
jgi:hypothetical protein